MENAEVAKVLYEIADYLELQGIAFKPQAYRRAASAIEGLGRDIEEYRKTGSLQDISGIGENISEKISELLSTGKLGYLERLRAEIPYGLLELLEVPEVGPKTAMLLYRELGIKSIDELKKAIFEHKLRGIKGFGAKTEERILQGIGIVESKGGRMLLGTAYEAASLVISRLQEMLPEIRISMAGSLRRMKETIGDIDILAASDEQKHVMDAFTSMKGVKEILAKGSTKSSVRLATGVQVDLRVVPTASWGAALQYFTGSKEHNVQLRTLAISKGMKINEYGLFDRETDKQLMALDEEEIYRMLGLQYIPPEMREARGEIEIAANKALPAIIGYDELRGDLHCHTEWSDASGTIEEVWEKAKQMGYEYVAISDHSQSLRIASGLSEGRIIEQAGKIRKLRDSLGPPWIFVGSEIDVLGDGKLDFPANILNELDYAVMSIHTKFKMDEKQMTERIITALSNDKVKIFGHPTGRLIGQRAQYTFDFEKIVEAAKDGGVALEVNSWPDRLDLNDVNVKRAIALGAKVSIDSDSHLPGQMGHILYGIATARRGWARKSDVINAMPLSKLKKEWGLA